MSASKTAFVAYSSRDKSVADAVLQGVRKANALSLPIRYEPWEFNDIAGIPLISPIISKIEDSSFIVADITYLNPNVVYEIGYAIGKNKRVFLIRNSSLDGDKNLAKSVGIFDTLGYIDYMNADDVKFKLSNYIDETPLPIMYPLDRQAPVYIVEPPVRNAAATITVSRLKKARYRYRSFSPTEDSRLSASDAIRQVSASSGIALLIQEVSVSGSDIHNIRTMFTAGLAHGMGKPTLILCPLRYEPPLDIRDNVKKYRDGDDIASHVAEFCLEITDYSQQSGAIDSTSGNLLQHLTLGDPTAENEMTTLSTYYLRTDQYQRALRGEVNLVVGRKGSGKTALFIQVRDRVRSDKRNIVVDLKPEGYQLIKLKEDILTYLTDGARQHLITGFWEYLILLEVAYKLLEKDKSTYKFDHQIYEVYTKLESIYRTEDFSTEGDFSERLLMLAAHISQKYKDKYGSSSWQKLSTEEVTELLYKHDIRELRKIIGEYIEIKSSVWILFDNLDKGWSTQGVDQIDVIVLRCLIEAGRKIEREMQKVGHRFRCIIFIRNDVYENLMKGSSDFGKDMRATLDWTDADLLKEMLRLRLVSNLADNMSNKDFSQVWLNICSSHFYGEESFGYIVERSLMRPRNILKIISHARGFANNLAKSRIGEDEIDKGLKAYSQDLIIELDRELIDIYPAASDLIYHFIEAPESINRDSIHNIIMSAGLETDIEKVIDFLLYYGVLGIRIKDKDLYIFDVAYDLKMLKIRLEKPAFDAVFVINKAFWPALGIVSSEIALSA